MIKTYMEDAKYALHMASNDEFFVGILINKKTRAYEVSVNMFTEKGIEHAGTFNDDVLNVLGYATLNSVMPMISEDDEIAFKAVKALMQRNAYHAINCSGIFYDMDVAHKEVMKEAIKATKPRRNRRRNRRNNKANNNER